MSLTFRRARPEDAETLTEIAIAANRHWGDPDARIQKRTPLLTFTPQKIGEADIFAAGADDELAAFYRFFLRQPRATLEDLWVRPDFMEKGIGRALFHRALRRGRSPGAKILEVESDPHAPGFYEKMGMHQAGKRLPDVDDQRALPVMEMKL